MAEKKGEAPPCPAAGPVFEKSHDAMMLFDSTARISGANSAACAMLGHTAAELSGVELWKITPRAQRKDARKTWAQFLKTGRQAGQFRFSTESRRRIEVDYRAAADVVPGVHLWSFRDITERRMVEREILESDEKDLRRVGKELHDYLNQELTGIAYFMRTVEERLTARKSPDAPGIRELSGMLNRAVARAREITAGLVPVKPEPHGLCLALEELAAATSEAFHLDCTFDCERPVLLPPYTGSQLFRIAEEAVRNAVRHGRPHHIWLELSRGRETVTLTIRDDGRGWVEPLPQGRGLGLKIIRHRADILDAHCRMESGPGAGTLIAVTCRAEEPERRVV
jgi:PAS domain S-box-containing protein